MKSENIVDQAVQLAAKAHQDQLRKFTDIPYFTHPVGVALILAQHGFSEELIAAGLLHDTVEDTNLSIEDIKSQFGDYIAEIVEGCSEPDKTQEWQLRKSHTTVFMREAPFETKIVACADKLHNIRSIIYDYQQMGEKIWDRFNQSRSGQEWYYRSLQQSFLHPPNSLADIPIYKEFNRSVNALFGGRSSPDAGMEKT